MNVSEFANNWDHEQIVFCNDKDTGLKAIIAIHDTTLGPALGGCRFWNYESQEEALFDVLRLSRGMTYKAAVAGLPLGGGKSVLIGDPDKLKSEAFFKAFGRFVQSLSGRYITAEDVNIRVADMNQVSLETNYVTGISTDKGGSGDPSPVTAWGVFCGIKAAAQFRLKKDSLKGLKVAVQGCGSVGRYLCDHLHSEGVELIISDINPANAMLVKDKTGARVVQPDQIFAQEVDIFAPCALGAVLNDQTIPELKSSVVAGGANNQLLDEDKHMKMLTGRNILYAPDYVINAGGLINVCAELQGYDAQRARNDASKIFDTLSKIFKSSETKGMNTLLSANALAEESISSAKKAGKPSVSQTYENQSWIKRPK